MTTPAYPLQWPTGWDRTADEDRMGDHRFKVTFDKAMKDLHRMLGMLGAQSVVVSSYLPLGRRGEPLGGAARTRYEDPGVAVYFFRGDKQYVLARDAFDTPLGNLRSIGLALEGLKQLELHGGATLAERAFGGFAALPPPEPPFDWRKELGLPVFSNMDPDVQLALASAAHKALAKKNHPDNGGSAEAMARLNQAIEKAREELRA